MAAGELAEGGQDQLLGGRVEGEAGQPQPVGTAPDQGDGVAMAADVEQAGPRLGGVAQPGGTHGHGGLLLQTLEPGAPFVVAADQPQGATQQVLQGPQLLAQVRSQA